MPPAKGHEFGKSITPCENICIGGNLMEELKKIILELLNQIDDREDEKFLNRICISLKEYVKEKTK